MNFRQRMGWLMVILFLSLSGLVIYYMFEIGETYNGLVLEHVQSYANSLKTNPEGITWRQTITGKLVALPFWCWGVIFAIPYLQVFCLLIACTKNDPLTASIAMAPICLVLRVCSCKGKEVTTSSKQYGLDVPVHT
ncbi:lysosomal enzyme trafficking factor-like [Asterias amurensis]|uniref:lysosomal enzyme trafficking factor-like n=1 Tax=Asterias amurensis TaxID=7602 RepID=UPI003AB741AB